MTKCRICKGKLIQIINLGKIALVGNFLKRLKKIKKFKISLNYCKICKHVQIAEILNPSLLFRNYLWETGVSKSNISLINDLLIGLKKNLGINLNSKVLEIASNDGSFLNIIRKKFNCFIVGVDPAKNFKKKLTKNKILTIFDFFNSKLSMKLKKKFKQFDFIFARNVVAHVPNPNEIFKGADNLLTEKGVFIIEVPHFLKIYKFNQYDNIFHEHVGYHSLKSIIDLSENNNLKVFDVEEIDSQGGSIRCYICKKNYLRSVTKRVKLILSKERKLGLMSSIKLKQFKFKIVNHIRKMKKIIAKLKNEKKNVSIYGASGKGQALMQYCNINNKTINYVFDKSTLKQNCFTPGTNIKILNPKYLNISKTKYLLILSWNIKKEIINQEKRFAKLGGKFIIPFPSPRILN